MALEKNDLKQIEKIVDRRAKQTEITLENKLSKKIGKVVDDSVSKIVDKKISASEKNIIEKLEVKIENEIGNLAAMTKRGFDAVDKKFDDIKEKMLVHDFKMSEMVHKSDHLQVVGRVAKIETKLRMTS